MLLKKNFSNDIISVFVYAFSHDEIYEVAGKIKFEKENSKKKKVSLCYIK